MKTHLLIDGDVIAFTAASAAQGVVHDSFGWSYPMANLTVGKVICDNLLFSLEAGLKADSFEVVLSDPETNWRHSVDPTYKGNRDPGMKPLLLGKLKDHLREKHGADHWPSLEADDVLGIKGTDPVTHLEHAVLPDGAIDLSPTYRNVIIVGRDKDFKSIPGLHHQLKDLSPNGSMRVREISQWEADRFHLIQTLAGDAVDGYAGCPGVDMKRAEEIIDSPVRLVPQDGVKTRGVNKGERTVRWMSEPTRDYWACIVTHYQKAGLSEKEALVTARLARILRHGEYDRSTERLTLWTPDRIPHV